MTKDEFISQVKDMYNEIWRMARNAQSIVEAELDEHGDMDYDYIDDDRVWLVAGNQFLHYIHREEKTGRVVIGLKDDGGFTVECYLADMTHIDQIEIADSLCHR